MVTTGQLLSMTDSIIYLLSLLLILVYLMKAVSVGSGVNHGQTSTWTSTDIS
jgi:hypothetical protein